MLLSDIQTHVRFEYVQMLVNREVITLEKYTEMRMNSYEREYLLPLFNEEVLMHITEYAIKNCRQFRPRIATTYDEMLQVYAAELIKRLRSK